MKKPHQRHGRLLGSGLLILALASGSLFYTHPRFSAQAVRSLAGISVHVSPGANGLVAIGHSTASSPTSSGIGSASEAGQGLQMQLLLQTVKSK